MKPNVTKSNRKQTKRNETNYKNQYNTLLYNIQHSTIYTLIQREKTQTKLKETIPKTKPNETKAIQTKSNQHYNTINNNIILNFTRIRNLMTLKTLNVHRTPPNT